jgi:hypothetical protein
MALKKPAIILASLGAGAILTIAGMGAVSAQGDDSNSIVDKLSSKFNLNKTEVQKVFDEEHATRAAEHKQKLEERLTQAVKDGKITEDQKGKILAKFDEEKAFRDSLKDKSEDERKAAMKQHRLDMQQWAADNDIDLRMIHFGPHGGGRPGMDKPDDVDNAS